MEVTLSGPTQIALVVIAIVNVLLLAGLIGAVFAILAAVKKMQTQIQPVIDRTKPIMDRVPVLMDEAKPVIAGVNPLIEQNEKPILGNVQEITHKVSGIVSDLGTHVHEIAETGEQTVKNITQRVESTGQVVTENVAKPVISAASVFAGISRAFSVLKNYQKSAPEGAPGVNGNGRHETGDGAKSAPAGTL
jgi:uncharacterized protein YoxC